MKTLTPAALAHKKVKQKSISKLKKDADKWCSLWVRRQGEDQEGFVACYTCGKRHGWKAIQAGHFIRRNISTTRYDSDNLRPQCVGCNIWGRGQVGIFADNLLKEVGDKRFKELLARGRETKQFQRKELEEIIQDFKGRVEALEKK